jgi:ureidoacrylate peracid hydrolase
MISVEGKIVYTTLDEIARPAHTALLVVDAQRDFMATEGVFGGLGGDLSVYPPMIERLSSLLEAARRAKVRIVYVRHCMLQGAASESPAQLRFNLRISLRQLGTAEPLRYAVEGTAGAEIVPELAPAPDELVVTKHRSSAFWGTNLRMLLLSNRIESIVVTGCTTEGCVESTARDGLFNDFYTVVVEDCVASDDSAQHEASLLLMRHRFDVVRSSDLVELWAKE